MKYKNKSPISKKRVIYIQYVTMEEFTLDTQIVAPPSGRFFFSGALKPVGTMKGKNLEIRKLGSIYQLISVMTFSPFHSIGTKHTTFCCYVDYRIANALEKQKKNGTGNVLLTENLNTGTKVRYKQIKCSDDGR